MQVDTPIVLCGSGVCMGGMVESASTETPHISDVMSMENHTWLVQYVLFVNHVTMYQ